MTLPGTAPFQSRLCSRHVIIVGGGISGLATAYYLSQAGIRATLIERAPRLGGLIQTEQFDGCTIEKGPDSFLTAKPWAADLAREIGLGGDLIGSNDHLRATYIWRGGRLIRMPDGMTLMVPGKMLPLLTTPLLSPGGRLRAALEVFRRPLVRQDDVSLADFVIDHYGQEVLDYIAEPLLAGVYGGDPRELSAGGVFPKFIEWERKYGSLTRASFSEVRASGQPLFTTLRNGLASFTDRLAERAAPEIIHGTVDRIEQGWRVRVNGAWLEAQQVVVACPHGGVLPDLFPKMSYSSACVAALAYRRADIVHPLNGFGFLVPRIERKSLAACTWVGKKFDHRVPDDKVLIRCFVTDGAATVLEELREKMGITAEPLWTRVTHWPNTMPQYTVGHSGRIRLIEEMLADFPGLHLTGNAYHGVGIPDCVRIAKDVAGRVAAMATSS